MLELLADNDIARLSLLGLLFMAVVFGAFAVLNLLNARAQARERLAPDGGESVRNKPVMGSLRSAENEGTWGRLVAAIENSGLSLADTKDHQLRQRLAAAGFRQPYAPRVYTLVRLALVVALPLTLVLVHWLRGELPGLFALYIQAMIAALLGLYLPALFVRARADRRQRDLLNGFPDALDLMLVCVEAGLGLEAAFSRVGEEMVHSHPLIAEQLGTVVLELRAGRSREDALRRLADRTEVDEIRAFATLLIQSTKLGSSVGQTLRIYAAEMREKRRMRAEEKAHRLPVLLSVPLVACMLPVMIGVLMLPAFIRVVRSVLPSMTGGGV
jgi:tight adherence protein C